MNQNESLSEVHESVSIGNKKGWRRILAFLGPAYLVSVGYMDPGNWATDIAGGSAFGYNLIWVLLMSNLIAILLQTLSARLGIVRGMDLAQASKNAYPKWANIPLYILAEIAIAACDLAEIIGMAIGLNLLFGLPLIWGIGLTAFDTFLLLYLLNKGMRTMEVFIVSMVSVIGLSFLLEMFIVTPQYGEVLKGFIPSKLGGSALYLAIGIIGATIMPHNLYLHSSLVQTRKFGRDREGMKTAIKMNFFDTTIALNLAFFVNAAILILAAAAFYVNGYYQVAEIQDASKLLENLFGKAAPTLFAIALVASGQSSTVTGTLAGQIVMEGHLNLRIKPWLRRLITRVLAIVPAMFTIIYFGEQALGNLLVLSQVVLSLQLGFAIIPLIHFTSDRHKMKEFAIKNWVKVLAWVSAVVIVFLNIQMVAEQIREWLQASSDSVYIYIFVIPIAILLLLLLLFIFIQPLFPAAKIRQRTQLPHGYAKGFQQSGIMAYQHVGIGVDFSLKDPQIISNALRQGGKSAHYTIIHVVESAGARYHGQETFDLETMEDRKSLENYQRDLEKLGYKVSIEIGFGDPSKVIASIIEKENIDFLVLGSHGHRRIKNLIFGTTIDSVRKKIHIPILLVN